MALANRTKTTGVKKRRSKKIAAKKPKDLSSYVNYVPDGETIDISDSFLDYVFLLYGESGSGKTSTLAQAPGAYVIQCDPNRRGLKIRQTNIPNHSLKMIRSDRSEPSPWEIVVATVDAAIEDNSVNTIIIDNFRVLYDHASNHYCRINGVDSLRDMEDFGVSWNCVDAMYAELFSRIVDSGRGLGLITHQKETEVELPSGKTFTQIQPDLSGRPFQAVRQMTDFVFYLMINAKAERELVIRPENNDLFYKCCTDLNEPRFFTPENVPVKRLSMGKSPQEGWENLMKSWDNKMPCVSPKRKLKKKVQKK